MTNKIEFPFDTPDQSLGYLLWQTTMQWQRQMNRALKEMGLTHTQFVILMALAWLTQDADSSSGITQKDIAEHSNTDRMMVSKILNTLEQQGLINREPHPTDTRAKCVLLTTKGALVLQQAIAIKTQANDVFFKNIADKPKLAEQLKKLCH